jgi:flagellar assembly factor FliW
MAELRCGLQGFEEERRVRIVVSEEIEDAGHSGRRLRVRESRQGRDSYYIDR